VSTRSAHVGCIITPGPFGHAREVYHAVIDQPMTIGALTRAAGRPLCGGPGTVGQYPPGLFEPVVSCPACLAIAAREGITLAGAA
jgi:hypothetical protein